MKRLMSIRVRNLFLGQQPKTKGSSCSSRRRRRNGNNNVGVCEKVVGIDLGTTNSAVAAMEGGKPTIVTNAEGQRTIPSVVVYTKNGDKLLGQIAKRQAVVNPENTFFSVKRFIRRKMSEVDEEAKQVGKFITFLISFYYKVSILTCPFVNWRQNL